ncbi:hypothetical protein PYW08_010935 [Mythimna loreyi]|uniref:Uncharacterized protein n=1 Tax=Mythimna loreyi TaxID=667449 RepID=A0ACC2Q364_9NEOP|nr:hypothetical protein PYW08_010935 [Mythimna loreyi]
MKKYKKLSANAENETILSLKRRKKVINYTKKEHLDLIRILQLRKMLQWTRKISQLTRDVSQPTKTQVQLARTIFLPARTLFKSTWSLIQLAKTMAHLIWTVSSLTI